MKQNEEILRFKCFLLVLLINILFVQQKVAQAMCSSSLQASILHQKNFTSPNYPSTYPAFTDCQWNITAPYGYVVELTFKSFSTHTLIHGSHICEFGDILYIYDGYLPLKDKLRGMYCGSQLPANVYSTGRFLHLVFKSDTAIEYTGFMIEYKAKLPKPNSTICSPFNTFSQNNNIKYTVSSGYITSPLYGTRYPSNMQCTWVIQVPSGFKIKLTFLDLKMSCNKYYASLEIRDGQHSSDRVLGTKCGSSAPSPVYSTGKYMQVMFNSYLYNFYSDNTAGFKAKFEQETSNESVSQSSSSGAIIIALIGVVVIVIILIVILCVMLKRRNAGHANQAPAQSTAQSTAVQSTIQNNLNSTEATPQHPQVGRFTPPPPSGCLQPPTSGYPPPTTSDGAPGSPQYPTQPCIPMMPHPLQPVPDQPPPPYPGLPPQPQETTTAWQPQASIQPAGSSSRPPYQGST